ncbi:MAG: hypothetical protein ACYTE3_21625 [Planctomycetota bacterium]|jgi:hypothetical protein
MMNNDLIVDTILLALKTGARTETEAVAEYGDLAKHDLLDWDYLYRKNETLYRKVEEWHRAHPPEL